MGRTDPSHLVVGHINKPHGTQGEIVVWPLTDHPEGVYAPGVVLLMGRADDDAPDPDLPPLRIEAVRPYKKGYLVFFAGVENRDHADALRDRYLFRRFEDIEPLAEGEFFYHQLLGLAVETVAGDPVGKVVEVFEMQPADLLQVKSEDREHMIPFLDHVVVLVDVEEGRVVIDPPEGLLDL